MRGGTSCPDLTGQANYLGVTMQADLISGRKVFQRPRDEGIEMLHVIQDVCLEDSITVRVA